MLSPFYEKETSFGIDKNQYITVTPVNIPPTQWTGN